MGVSNFNLYKPTEHFIMRAKERFGVSDDTFKVWLDACVKSATKYGKFADMPATSKLYKTPDHVVLVCDTEKFLYKTCYSVEHLFISDDDCEEDMTISQAISQEYKADLIKLKKKYALKVARGYLENSEQSLYALNQAVRNLTKPRVAINDYREIQKALDSFHEVKGVFKELETALLRYKID